MASIMMGVLIFAPCPKLNSFDLSELDPEVDPAISTFLIINSSGMLTVNSSDFRMRSWEALCGDMATASIGGFKEMGVCHAATMVLGLPSSRSAVTSAAILGDKSL